VSHLRFKKLRRAKFFKAQVARFFIAPNLTNTHNFFNKTRYFKKLKEFGDLKKEFFS
jgi:hypothetical protein